jgi:DNA-3-methyladenine glycosylase I
MSKTAIGHRNPLYATGSPRPGGRLPIARGPSVSDRRRCAWATREPLKSYHDHEWGVAEHRDRRLFEFLVLEGMQAGLSWETILRKRPAFRRAFARFDPVKVARFGARDVARLMKDESIIRNRAKIEAAIANAKAFGDVRREFGSFDRYVWEFTDKLVLSKDLKRRGFGFVGPTIVESFMQAVGMRNDHEPGCYRRREITPRSRDKRAAPRVQTS